LLSSEFSLSEYSKIDVGWGFTPDPTGGSLQRKEGNGGEGREGLGEGEKRGRESGIMVKGGEKGEVGE